MTEQTNQQGGFIDILQILVFALVQAIVIEAIGNHLVFSKEEYKDVVVKIKNLTERIKKLKYDYLYKPSTKKKQEQKMILV
jgi:uncharacterized membrane protein